MRQETLLEFPLPRLMRWQDPEVIRRHGDQVAPYTSRPAKPWEFWKQVTQHAARTPFIEKGLMRPLCESEVRGPSSSAKHEPPLLKPTRPGSLLKWAIWHVTGEVPSSRCQCNQRAWEMDRWGWMGCWRRRRRIAVWLIEEAANRGHQVTASTVRSLWLAAIRELRHRRKEVDRGGR